MITDLLLMRQAAGVMKMYFPIMVKEGKVEVIKALSCM